MVPTNSLFAQQKDRFPFKLLLKNIYIYIYVLSKQAIFRNVCLPCHDLCLHHFNSFLHSPKHMQQNTPNTPGNLKTSAKPSPQAVSQAMTEGAQLVPRARVAQLQVPSCWGMKLTNQAMFTFHIYPAYHASRKNMSVNSHLWE